MNFLFFKTLETRVREVSRLQCLFLQFLWFGYCWQGFCWPSSYHFQALTA